MNRILEDLLPFVEKPGRYIGGEVHAAHKDRQFCKVSIALAFPDTYEMGMSHLGLQILYAILNHQPDIVAERVYAPWPDMERLMRAHKLPLSTLESGIPLSGFDLVGFSLQYELSFTNVLTMLDLGGIPLRRRDRRNGDPIIVAGGPCAFNPAPMDDFIDAFAIGEGEELILDMAQAIREAKEKGRPRQDVLEALARIEGLYVPDIHRSENRIKKRIVTDLNSCFMPRHILTPLMKTIHDRVTLEIARGCTRGCRFCQAGMVWRPVRERRTGELEKMAEDMLAASGQDELSLLSLSSGDYSRIEPLLSCLMDRYYGRRIALALPSLRVETLTQNLIENIRRVRKTSFTLAPEAGTQQLRNRINKGNTEADLLDTVRRVFEADWRAVKLYFMIGLPGETDQDVEGIAELAYKALGQVKKRGQVTVSISTFIPKAHTPFQWERQIDLEETRAKQHYLMSRLRHRHIEMRWHDHRMSLLEGLFARGDERQGHLIETAYSLGCRFDGWSDQFRFDLWEEALKKTGIQTSLYLRARDRYEALPWGRIDCGLDDAFLMAEADRAHLEELTPDCRRDACQSCGVCDHQVIKTMTAESAETNLPTADQPIFSDGTVKTGRTYRLAFTKTGRMRFLSHLDISTTLLRALSMARLPILFSEGFHPHPKISFAFATPVGMESREEYADIQSVSLPDNTDGVREQINACLPEGMEVISLAALRPDASTLAEAIRGFSFSVGLPDDYAEKDMEILAEKISDFLKAASFNIIRKVKGADATKEIRSYVEDLRLDRSERRLSMTLRFGVQGTVRPMDILTQVLQIPQETATGLHVLKEKTFFNET